MFEPGANLRNRDAVEGCDLERRARLAALHRIETALSMVIAAATYDVPLTGEEQGVRAATAQLDDLFVEDVEGFLPRRKTNFVIDCRTELAAFVVAPGVDLGLGRLGELVRLMQLWRHQFSADYHGEVGSAGDLFDLLCLEALD